MRANQPLEPGISHDAVFRSTLNDGTHVMNFGLRNQRRPRIRWVWRKPTHYRRKRVLR